MERQREAGRKTGLEQTAAGDCSRQIFDGMTADQRVFDQRHGAIS
jgi:hypothetical protein